MVLLSSSPKWPTLPGYFHDWALVDVETSGLRPGTPARLAGAPTFEEIAPQVGALLSRRVLVAHNAQFDYDFLAHEFAHVRSWVPVGSRLCTLALNRLAGPAGHRVSRHDSALSDTWALRPSRLAPAAPAVPDLGGSPRPGGNDGVGIVGFLLGDMGPSRETKGVRCLADPGRPVRGPVLRPSPQAVKQGRRVSGPP